MRGAESHTKPEREKQGALVLSLSISRQNTHGYQPRQVRGFLLPWFSAVEVRTAASPFSASIAMPQSRCGAASASVFVALEGEAAPIDKSVLRPTGHGLMVYRA